MKKYKFEFFILLDDIRFEDSTETFCYSALHLKDIDMR